METKNAREERGLKLLSEGAVKRVDEELYTVKSQTGIGTYRVENKDGWNCNCPDHIKRELDCKHIYATRYYLEVRQETDQGIEITKIPLTYGQAWSAYNQAQRQEIELFDELLKDLVASIPEEERGMGRPRIPLSEALFCSVQKTYSQLSLRRAQSLFNNAVGKEQLNHSPHYNIVSKTLLRKDVTPILHALIRLSALPLASIEKDFAIDSTGFRTTSFGVYCGTKHGIKRQHKWLKAHISSGVRTNIVTDAIVTDGKAADAPHFKPLILNTAEIFSIGEVSADAAYSSRDNHDVVGEVGGQPYIDFKKNATGKAGASPMWKKAFHFFKLHHDEFEEHYHKRSNVESTIGAIKKKFGETLKSKNRVAQENELLCKILAYNITVLIQQMFENGIDPKFMSLKLSACRQSREEVGL